MRHLPFSGFAISAQQLKLKKKDYTKIDNCTCTWSGTGTPPPPTRPSHVVEKNYYILPCNKPVILILHPRMGYTLHCVLYTFFGFSIPLSFFLQFALLVLL